MAVLASHGVVRLGLEWSGWAVGVWFGAVWCGTARRGKAVKVRRGVVRVGPSGQSRPAINTASATTRLRCYFSLVQTLVLSCVPSASSAHCAENVHASVHSKCVPSAALVQTPVLFDFVWQKGVLPRYCPGIAQVLFMCYFARQV